LRTQAAKGTLSPVEALTELQARAATGDLEAVQYAGDIEALAESLRLDGLIYPLKVEALTLSNGRAGGRILDGERRYWASVWCSMQSAEAGFAHATIDVLVLHHERDGAALERLQWAANTQRRDMPVMILAEAASRVHAELAVALKVNRVDTFARYGLVNIKNGRERMLLVKVTAMEMQRRTGKVIGERMLYRLLMFVNRITAEARRLAIAANLDYRALETVAAAEPAAQASIIRSMLMGDEAESTQKHRAASAPGIAHAMQQFLTMGQVAQTGGRTWSALCHADAEIQKAYLLAARDALAALTRHVHEVERLVNKFP
jgi:non-ribosomal peptide synthetase component F